MPQPVLGGIVLSALIGIIDIGVLRKLLKYSRSEAIIWGVAAIGVIIVGTLFGVIVGVVLSFIDVIVRITAPPQAYLGRIKGRDGYYDLKNHKSAKEVPDVVIYRFSASLIFANVGIFKKSIDEAVEREKPKAVIVDGSGINAVDTTAIDSLKEVIKGLDDQGIPIYFAGLIAKVTRQLSDFGLDELEEKGRLPKTIDEALKEVSEKTEEVK